jgi:hypothetical protein
VTTPQLSLLTVLEQPPTIAERFRNSEQWKRVYAALSSGEWMTLEQIKKRTLEMFGKQDSETGISARIRQMPPYEKRVVEGYSRLYEYRLRTARSA